MEYIIQNKKNTYIPIIRSWIIEDLHLKLRDAALYSLILTKGYLVWTSKYIGEVLCCHEDTIQKDVAKLEELDVIEKKIHVIDSRKHWVLVAKYTIDGKRSTEEIQSLIDQGVVKLDCMFKENKRYYKKRKNK